MSLKQKTISGFFWVLINQFGNQGISFAITIVLARLLLPSDFGLIAMIGLFIGIGQALIDSGLTSSLMRKEQPDEKDYSTIFYTNILGSLVIYAMVFILAPFIAHFYRQPVLTDVIRLLGLSFFINAFSNIQNTILTKELKFRKLMMVSVPAYITAGIVGIIMAYNGYGVWSLVTMQLASAVVSTLLLWKVSKWRPGPVFSIHRLKEHYRFGINMTAAGILDTLFANLFPIVIGRYFSAAQVGYYGRAMSLKQLPVANISSALRKVTYPVFASIQQDDVKLKSAYKMVMQQVTFWIAPILIGMAVLAEPLFRMLFTEKWLPAAPYFQILCFEGIMYPLNAYNLNVLKVKGRSDLFLKLEIVKKLLAASCLVFVFTYGIYGLLYFQVAASIISFFINSYYTGKFINYTPAEQLKDILPSLVAALCMGGLCFIVLSNLEVWSDWAKLITTSLIGFLFYYGVSYVTRSVPQADFHQIVVQRLRLKARTQ